MTRVNRSIILLTALSLLVAAAGIRDRSLAGENPAPGAAGGKPFDSAGTIDEYIRFALENNPRIRSAYYSWQSGVERAARASWLTDPTLSVGYLVENVETRVGPQRYRLGLRQKIPWFGTLSARKDRELQGAGALRQSYLSRSASVVFQVRTRYLDYYHAARKAEILEEEMSLLRQYEAVALAGYRAGETRHGDLIRVQIELATLEDRLAALGDEMDTAAAMLAEALGIGGGAELPPPAAMPGFGDPGGWEETRTRVLEGNPEIRAAEYMVEREMAAERLAGKGYFPDMTIGLDYIVTGEAVDPSMPESGKDPWGVSVSLTLPVWFGRTSAERREARAGAEMNRYLRRSRQEEVLAVARKAHNGWKESARKEELYEKGLVPTTERLLETVYSAYRAGDADFMEVISTQRQLLDMRLRALHARVNKAKMKAELDLLAGFGSSAD